MFISPLSYTHIPPSLLRIQTCLYPCMAITLYFCLGSDEWRHRNHDCHAVGFFHCQQQPCCTLLLTSLPLSTSQIDQCEPYMMSNVECKITRTASSSKRKEKKKRGSANEKNNRVTPPTYSCYPPPFTLISIPTSVCSASLSSFMTIINKSNCLPFLCSIAPLVPFHACGKSSSFDCINQLALDQEWHPTSTQQSSAQL